MNCQHQDYTPDRCRRRAKVAFLYARPFGTRVGPHGDEPIFQEAITFRCPDHENVPWEILGTMPAAEYLCRITEHPYVRP